MKIEEKPLNEITQDAIKVLTREIGIGNTIRFINQFSTGHGNYTEERDRLFENMSLDDIVAETKKIRNKSEISG
jgi:hypothetical protein